MPNCKLVDCERISSAAARWSFSSLSLYKIRFNLENMKINIGRKCPTTALHTVLWTILAHITASHEDIKTLREQQ